MLDDNDFLRLLPKAELHCHFVATMRVETLMELADAHDVPLRTTDMDDLLRYRGLPDFLDVFHAAQQVLRTTESISRVAYESVVDAVRAGNLRYREYFVNPDNFAELDIPYPDLIEALVSGFERAEREYGVGFGIICAINRSLPAQTAVEMVQTMLAHPHPAVLGIGQDYLTPELTEDPLRFRAAYALAEANGLRRSAHVGETMTAPASHVHEAIEHLHVDRVDHGYRVVDDPDTLDYARASGVAFTCTPHSTRMLSQWDFDENHRIAQMIRSWLVVTLATDDTTLFHTDIAREYTVALPAMGVDVDGAVRIARAGFEAAWCDDTRRQRLLADFDAAVLALTGTRG